jgi:pimeloyl-ACP methyl ester carboxylesterase
VPPRTFILVHGASHGAWCWYKIIPLLEEAGHTVIALDLPALGLDQTPLAAATLDKCVDKVSEVLERQPGQSTLIAHSMGGLTISQVAERHPEKVAALVYVCAFLLRDGETLFAVSAQDPGRMPGLASVSADKLSMSVDTRGVREVLYNECASEDVALASLLLRPQPLAPMNTRQRVSASRFGRVPRVYIECLRDRVVPPALQRAMYTAAPGTRVITMDTDHSPFFSRPRELVHHLLSL